MADSLSFDDLIKEKYEITSFADLDKVKCPVCNMLLFWPSGIKVARHDQTFTNSFDYDPYCINKHYYVMYFRQYNSDVCGKFEEVFRYSNEDCIFEILLDYTVPRCRISKFKQIEAVDNPIGRIKLDRIPNWDYCNLEKMLIKIKGLFLLL